MGLGVTESLVQKGWNVTIVDFNEKAGKETAEKFGSQVLFVKGNVVKYEDQVEAFVKTWEKWGRLDFGMDDHSRGPSDNTSNTNCDSQFTPMLLVYRPHSCLPSF